MKHPNNTVREIIDRRARGHLIEVTDMDEVSALHNAGLGAPHVYSSRIKDRIHFWTDADELRAWRASQSTSEAAK